MPIWIVELVVGGTILGSTLHRAGGGAATTVLFSIWVGAILVGLGLFLFNLGVSTTEEEIRIRGVFRAKRVAWSDIQEIHIAGSLFFAHPKVVRREGRGNASLTMLALIGQRHRQELADVIHEASERFHFVVRLGPVDHGSFQVAGWRKPSADDRSEP